MVNVIRLINLSGSVLEATPSGDQLLIMDSQYNLHIIGGEKYELEKTVALTKTHENPHKYANVFAIAKNRHINAPFLGTKKSVVVHVGEQIAKKAVIGWHEAEIECSAFSTRNNYLATGGQDGRTYLFETRKFRLISSLPNRSDYINYITFSNNTEYLACAGFDKFTVIFDITRNKTRHAVKTPDVVEKCKFYDKDRMLYMILRNGGSVIYDVVHKQTVSTENIFHTWATAMDISEDGKYAVVGTRSEVVYIVRLEDNAKMIDVKLEYNGISLVKFHNENLLLGFVDGTLAVVDYKSGVDELEECLVTSKNYKRAREIVDDNVFLSISPCMKVFDEDWPEILKKAINLLNANKIDEAVDMCEPFIRDPKKQKEFDFYLMQKNVVAQFAEMVKKKEVGKAYEMADINRFLTKTNAYNELEELWLKTFNVCRKLLEENSTLNRRKVEEALKPFEHTSKREIIVPLLKNAQIFNKAEGIIKKKDFKGYFSLVEKYPFLKGTELYDKVISLGEKMMDNFIRLEEDEKFEEALEIGKYLMDFPPLKRAVSDRINLMNSKTTFIQAVEQRNYKKAYAMLEKSESLKMLPQYATLKEDFDKKFERSKNYAYEGAAHRVMLGMSIYMEVPYWKDRIASIIKIAYIHEIIEKSPEKDINWQMTIKRYLQRFGKDPEIIKTLSDLKRSKLLDELEDEGDFEGYMKHPFVEEIVVYQTS